MPVQARHVGRVTAGTVMMTILFVLLQVTTALPAAAATINLDPPTGFAGDSVLVEGRSFLPGVPVEVCWVNTGCAGLGRADPDPSGEFNINVVIPDVTPGSYPVNACQGQGGEETCVQKTFVVQTPPPPPPPNQDPVASFTVSCDCF